MMTPSEIPIECSFELTAEVSSHDAYTPRELFISFFGVIADALREIIGADWSPEIDVAWLHLLDEIDGIVKQSES